MWGRRDMVRILFYLGTYAGRMAPNLLIDGQALRLRVQIGRNLDERRSKSIRLSYLA